MSDNKMPKKIYYEINKGYILEKRPMAGSWTTFIREDITLDAGLKELGDVQDLDEMIYQREQRREMFKAVALIKIKDSFGYSYREVAEMTDWILKDSNIYASKVIKS